MKILTFEEFDASLVGDESIILVKEKIVFGECVYADGVFVKNGEIVRLTPLQAKLLKFLENKSKFILPEDIYVPVWGHETSPQTLSFLVKQINKITDGKFIMSKHSCGYKLDRSCRGLNE